MLTHEAVVLGRLTGPQWRVEATLFAWQNCYTTLLTTTERDNPRAVGIEILPTDTSGQYTPGMREAWSRQWIARLTEWHNSPRVSMSHLPSLLNLEPLLEALDRYEDRPRISRSDPFRRWVDMTAAVAASVLDAHTYARAVAAGESPAKAIRDEHQIDIRSAEGRIRRARLRGFLTKVENTRTPSMLTAKAADALEELTGERPYPYATENGDVVLGPT